jgi:hypothetical protein
MTRKQIDCSILLLNPWPEREHWPVPEDVQRDALNEIATQIFEYVEEALKQRDPWEAASIMAKGERCLAGYTAEKFDQLLPLQQALQATLHTFWRMARRQFLKRALKAPDHEFPLYLATARDPKLGLDGPDADADFDAVVRHLEGGGPLYGDLRKRAN